MVPNLNSQMLPVSSSNSFRKGDFHLSDGDLLFFCTIFYFLIFSVNN